MKSARCSRTTADPPQKNSVLYDVGALSLFGFFTVAFLAAAVDVEFTMTNTKDDFLDYDDD
jgi:hypothetical protein